MGDNVKMCIIPYEFRQISLLDLVIMLSKFKIRRLNHASRREYFRVIVHISAVRNDKRGGRHLQNMFFVRYLFIFVFLVLLFWYGSASQLNIQRLSRINHYFVIENCIKLFF